jgi:hypothetical protein
VLAFRHMKTDSVSCSGDTCTVLVTIRAVFNPGAGETIARGLTAWISPEQRSAYLSRHTPSGEQAYHVQITYKRRGEAWRAVEFDRAPCRMRPSSPRRVRLIGGPDGDMFSCLSADARY